MSEEKIKRTFTKKGDKIVLKVDIPNSELKPKDVIDWIEGDEGKLQTSKDQIIQLEKNIENCKVNIENANMNIVNINENIGNLKKFEEWALIAQESKLKAIVAEVKDEVEKKVRDTYKYDDGMSKKDNNIQMFAQYREFISRHEKVAEQISKKVYSNRLYKKGYLVNPFVKVIPDATSTVVPNTKADKKLEPQNTEHAPE